MAARAPLDRDDVFRRQVRRVRRRWNARELQRALYLTVAVTTGASVPAVLLALRARPTLFAVGVSGLGAVAAATLAALAVTLARRWVGPRRAPVWVDGRAALRGRLATLAELGADRDAFLIPLLVEQNEHHLPTWTPARLIPGPVPAGALAAAVVAVAALAATLVVAPRLRPPMPEIFYSDVPLPADVGTSHGIPERILLAPVLPNDPEADAGAMRSAGAAEPDDRSPLAELASALQDRIQTELWGEEWKRAADAAAREERRRETASRRDRRERDTEADDGDRAEPWEEARLPASATRERPARDTDAASTAARRDAEHDSGGETSPGGPAQAQGPDDGPSGPGEAASGAGTGTSPELYGKSSETVHGESTPFDLGIVARMRAPRDAPRRPSGDTPPAAPDARPALGPRQRPESPAPRVAVPVAYESVVREIFARRAPEEDRP